MSNYKCDKSDTFRIEVVDTEISVTGLRTPVYEGESIAFTVTVTDVPSTGSYDLEVTAYGAANTTSSSTNSDIGFNSSCSDVEESDDVTAGAATHPESHTLHVCDSEYNGGGIITMALVDDDDNVLVGDWFYVEARPITVIITSNNQLPITGGSADERTVELKATVDGPSGVNLQWQEWSGTAWTNQGTPTPSNPATADVDASSEEVDGETEYLRGTKKYQVEASHATASTAYSEPFYVTWDELEILSDLSVALSAAVEADSGYTTAQTSLITCMTRTSNSRSISGITNNTTFNDLLSQYSGTTRLKMDGACSSETDSMFSMFESVTQTHIGLLNTGNAEYSAWFATPQGVSYLASAGNAEQSKLRAYFMSSDETSSPGQLEEPCYGEPGISRRLPCPSDSALSPGLECLPSGETAGNYLTLLNKLRVLNCLVFATPHDFWVAGEDGFREANMLYEGSTKWRWTWLGFEHWDCTISPDLFLPSCLKHDVAYGSLQKFAGLADSGELDPTWNPRNKALADNKYWADIAKHGCQDAGVWEITVPCRGLPLIPDSVWNRTLADLYFLGVAEANSKGWPITNEDFDHMNHTPEFVRCGDSDWRTNRDSAAPFPTLDVTYIRRLPGPELAFEATLQRRAGCVPNITANAYEVVWEIEAKADICDQTARNCTYTQQIAIGADGPVPTQFKNVFRGESALDEHGILEITSVKIVEVSLTPNNKVYGGGSYKRSLDRIVYTK